MTTKKANSQSQLASSPAATDAAPAMITYANAQPKHPSAILVTLDGSMPRLACQDHKAIIKGVKAKIMNGLNAWNQVVGISPCQMMRSMVRSVWSSAQRA